MANRDQVKTWMQAQVKAAVYSGGAELAEAAAGVFPDTTTDLGWCDEIDEWVHELAEEVWGEWVTAGMSGITER